MDSATEALLFVIKDRVKSKVSVNPKAQALLKKINSGNGSFRDTAAYSEIISNTLGEVFSGSISEMSEAGLKEYICTELLKDSYNNTNDVLATVQKGLDDKAGVNIAPQKADFPLDRVEQIAHSLEDPTVDIDVIKRRANGPVANVSKSFHDDYIKENAAFRSNAGFKCYINRVSDGNCCAWCDAVAGRYEYGQEPSDIYRRHDNCGCSVTYESGRTRQDVWSKKSWEAPETDKQPHSPTLFDNVQAKEAETDNLRFVGVDKTGRSGIINPRVKIDMQFLGKKNIGLRLSKNEYGKLMHEINTLYHSKYKDLSSFVHYSGNYKYIIKSVGFDNYNVIAKIRMK